MKRDLRFVLLTVCVLIQYGMLSRATNCAEPPKSIAPTECCEFPPVFKQNAFDYCDYVLNKGNRCFYECVYAATELCRRGQCDYRKADDYINWIWPEGHPFKDVYKRAFKDCMNQASITDNKVDQLKRNGCDPIPELLDLCVKNKMFSLCPTEHFNWNKTECIQERDFLENCILDA